MRRTARKAAAAIVGLGMTEMSRKFTRPPAILAVEAIRLAMEDAGLHKHDIDGLLINRSPVVPFESLNVTLQNVGGLRNLRLLNDLQAEGSTAAQMIQFAALAIREGLANAVACVFADTPLTPGQSAGMAFGQTLAGEGIPGMEAVFGLFGAPAAYALAARRHMALYGTTNDHLGTIAVSNRAWAVMNPLAVLREPLTLEAYHKSRWIVEPFHLLDCAMPVNGAIAVIVTSARRARELRQPPVYVVGMGQAHPGNPNRAGYENEVITGASLAKETAYAMAGITAEDINLREFYDPFTYVTLLMLEEYGFCSKGEGGSLVATGSIAPGGNLPTNTGGGHLSGYYMQGMTPISEAIIQARGQAGERQVAKHDMILVTNQGGRLDYHACLILSPHLSVQ